MCTPKRPIIKALDTLDMNTNSNVSTVSNLLMPSPYPFPNQREYPVQEGIPNVSLLKEVHLIHILLCSAVLLRPRAGVRYRGLWKGGSLHRHLLVHHPLLLRLQRLGRPSVQQLHHLVHELGLYGPLLLLRLRLLAQQPHQLLGPQLSRYVQLPSSVQRCLIISNQ